MQLVETAYTISDIDDSHEAPRHPTPHAPLHLDGPPPHGPLPPRLFESQTPDHFCHGFLPSRHEHHSNLHIRSDHQGR